MLGMTRIGRRLVVAIAVAATLLGLRVANLPARRPEAAATSAYVMGTYLEVKATGGDAQAGVKAVIARFCELDNLFNPSNLASDMARMAQAPGRPVHVSPDTIALLEHADAIYKETGGAFDLTVGPLVALWGFAPQDLTAVGTSRDAARTAPPSQAEIESALRLVGWSRVTWDKAAGTATLDAPGSTGGMSLATGGIAKGYALDEAARILRQAGVRSAVIDAGGSLYLLGARGEDGASAAAGTAAGAWRVAIRHPRAKGSGYLGTLAVRPDRSVSTSGDYERYFEADGVRYHHIIDPATGWPAKGAISVTVVAPSATEADGLSTALFVMGPEKGLALAESLPGVEALFVDAAGSLSMTPGMKEMFTPSSGGGTAGDSGTPEGGGAGG